MNTAFNITTRYLAFGLLSIVISGCGTGAKSYRPVGASEPANVVVQTKKPAPVSQPQPTSSQPETQPLQRTESDVHYIRPGQSAPDYRQPTSSRRPPPSSATRQPFSNRPSSYTINKISKTVAVHCTKQQLNQPLQFNRGSTQQTFCSYQFPKHCGNHRFSLIESGAKQILVYHDQQLQLNLLDSLSLSNQSKAGVWDLDDYVSSAASDVSSLFSSGRQDQLVGRIIQASARDKQQLASNYMRAVSQTASCF
ncbi:hypothetical protein H0A36_23855 [Endozoicomonas sp. SM1973]|uniref:Uncharacterized protein n=1 Tax=Spartinivicinus marinus TaxID=2994442 RepID=A0A853I593_9GAMM|nr:hypothetical protein [Spartinivicinus marinus]MCX4027691.1 hypothetical protein [Spartinivicinus marinus]NYZ69060.1 hypothetical protein [Spartinivicinus marinus]